MSRRVQIGNIKVGGNASIKIQSMTNTDTNDIESTVNQVIRIIEAGGELVRITAQGTKEAENLKLIRNSLKDKGYNQPLIADIHFMPKAAEIAAKYVDKVRINPGNYIDKYKKNKIEFTDQEYDAELARIEDRLTPLIKICKENNTALRIGSNQGSLSQRIMSKYGDTAEGMAQSAMEFLTISHKLGFDQIVVSMKSSNTRVMIESSLLIYQMMKDSGLNYPLHLGVTEAGDGLEGRIKSAFGIGALLLQGIGDTIRVSLTEPPENEIPVCKQIIQCIEKNKDFQYSSIKYTQRKLIAENIGGSKVPIVISKGNSIQKNNVQMPDYWLGGTNDLPFNIFHIDNLKAINHIPTDNDTILMIHGNDLSFQYEVIRLLNVNKILHPRIIHKSSNDSNKENFAIHMAIELSVLLNYDLIDGIWLENENLTISDLLDISFSILQAGRNRMSKTEFIACPSCGRTKFNISDALQKVKNATSHLNKLKIGVMGCIVNGPGEMADADYGYIGAGNGKVSLYKSKILMKANIREEVAVDELIKLIKEEGDWEEP